jgi:hypothetical protein
MGRVPSLTAKSRLIRRRRFEPTFSCRSQNNPMLAAWVLSGHLGMAPEEFIAAAALIATKTTKVRAKTRVRIRETSRQKQV